MWIRTTCWITPDQITSGLAVSVCSRINPAGVKPASFGELSQIFSHKPLIVCMLCYVNVLTAYIALITWFI